MGLAVPWAQVAGPPEGRGVNLSVVVTASSLQGSELGRLREGGPRGLHRPPPRPILEDSPPGALGSGRARGPLPSVLPFLPFETGLFVPRKRSPVPSDGLLAGGDLASVTRLSHVIQERLGTFLS